MGFLNNIIGGLKVGANYGQSAKIVQSVFGRNLNASERDLMQNYCQSMNFMSDMDPNEIALDFFAFLLTNEEHPSRILPPPINASQRHALKQVIIHGIKRGDLLIQGADKESLVRWIDEM